MGTARQKEWHMLEENKLPPEELERAEHNHLKNKIKYVYGFRFYKQEDWNKAFQEINL